MYLADVDIRAILAALDFLTDDPDDRFKPEDQIQPCSVDLRLDRIFWRQKRLRPIDLRRSHLMEIEPRRHWNKIRLNDGESITIKPGQMLLGRTFEKFTIPPGYAGKLEGRSSFARMGLAIHCSADFINPGYRGHMPLQLVNHGSSSITLVPRLPICQLMVIRLSSPSARVYGDRELYSKYIDDDGGPSYWWRDKRIQKLHDTLGRINVEDVVQDEILNMVGPMEPEIVDRLEKFMRFLPAVDRTNAADILDRFAARETTNRRLANMGFQLGRWVGPAMLTLSLGSLLKQPFGMAHYVLWAAAVLAIAFGIYHYLWRDAPGEYLDPTNLRRRRGASNAIRGD